jgi:hypothetical protein
MGCVVVTKTNFVGFFPKEEGDMALMTTWLQKKPATKEARNPGWISV